MTISHEAISAGSTVYLLFPGLRAFDPSSPDGAADPTTLPVQVAFVPPQASPQGSDWHDAEWVDRTKVRVLFGLNGTVTKPPGLWVVWLRVTGTFEDPFRPVGTLVVTK